MSTHVLLLDSGGDVDEGFPPGYYGEPPLSEVAFHQAGHRVRVQHLHQVHWLACYKEKNFLARVIFPILRVISSMRDI